MATETKEQCTARPWQVASTVSAEVNGWRRDFIVLNSVTRASEQIALVPNGQGEKGAANARLIAAAPELLEALKLAVSRFEYNPGHSDLDNEQPIHLPITLGDYRRINMLIHRAEGW